MKAEQLLITAATTGDVLMETMKEVCGHFGEDLDEQCLKIQLSALSDIVESPSPSLRVIQQAILKYNIAFVLRGTRASLCSPSQHSIC